MSSDAASRRRVSNAVASLAQFANSRSLDRIHAARSGVPLSLASIAVLGRVVEGSPIGLAELREVSRLQPAALSRHVRLLEQGGYIERSGDPDDGRAAVARVTPRGRAAHRRFRAANDDLLATQLVGWTSDELNGLAATMERLDADLRSEHKRAARAGSALATRRTVPAARG
jgi:DNA-binding MarR family transcriptional regulator